MGQSAAHADNALPRFLEALPLAAAGATLAMRAYAAVHDHRRADALTVHALEVAALLHLTGADEELVAAGATHDLLEHSATPSTAIHIALGPRVLHLVEAVTEDDGIGDYERRKATLRHQVRGAGADANALFAADKVSKVRELRTRIASGSPDHHALQLRHYRTSLEDLRATLPSHPLVCELDFELWALSRVLEQHKEPPGQDPGSGGRARR